MIGIEKLYNSAWKKILIFVIVFVLVACLFHFIKSLQPFLKTLVELGQVLTALAAFIGAYAAFRGVDSWRRQLYSAARLTKLTDFNKQLLTYEEKLNSAAELLHISLLKVYLGKKENVAESTIDFLERKESQLIGIIDSLRAEARIIDKLCMVDGSETKAQMLSELVRILSSKTNKYLKCRDYTKLKEYSEELFQYLGSIKDIVAKYEQGIN
ncbi:hypothetical protein [Shewanella aquimarina]|uniref:hypothetical protein n=1 Tax=Shewanella aquimarina TaxID=260365 RepID=UPI002014C621|nr:hypothetical protein [Shewanella aquimarina]MCL2910092.1 hypothetical protein [Shewanella aquimarina]